MPAKILCIFWYVPAAAVQKISFTLVDLCSNKGAYTQDETDKYIEAAVQLGNLSETDTDSALQLHRDTQKFVEALRQQSLQS